MANSLWLKDVKGCRWKGQLVKDLEEHAKEFELIPKLIKSFHLLSQMGLDLSFYSGKIMWSINSDEM